MPLKQHFFVEHLRGNCEIESIYRLMCSRLSELERIWFMPLRSAIDEVIQEKCLFRKMLWDRIRFLSLYRRNLGYNGKQMTFGQLLLELSWPIGTQISPDRMTHSLSNTLFLRKSSSDYNHCNHMWTLQEARNFESTFSSHAHVIL